MKDDVNAVHELLKSASMTSVSVRADGKLTVETRNRHEMAVRWLRALKGEKHIRLVASTGVPGEEDPE